MLLSSEQIATTVEAGRVAIEPYDERQLQGASYDLRVGNEGATSTLRKKISIEEQGFLMIEPGDFAVISTLEVLHFDNQHTARIGLRSKYARKGLVATTGLQVDPGFHGRLMVGLINLTPNQIALPHRDDLLSLEFHRLEAPSKKPYSGTYQSRMSLGPEELEGVLESKGMGLSEVLTTVAGLSHNVAQLDKTVSKLGKDLSGLGTKVNVIMWMLAAVVVPIAIILTTIAIQQVLPGG